LLAVLPGMSPAIHPRFLASDPEDDTALSRAATLVAPGCTGSHGFAEHQAPADSRQAGFSAHPLPAQRLRRALRSLPASRRLLPPLHFVLRDESAAHRDRLRNAQFFPADAGRFAPDSGG